jgi:hypothetical protein
VVTGAFRAVSRAKAFASAFSQLKCEPTFLAEIYSLIVSLRMPKSLEKGTLAQHRG